MKIRGLYDGGILIFVGVFFIAIGLATAGVGLKKVNHEKNKEYKESQKPIVIPFPVREKPKPVEVDEPEDLDWTPIETPMPAPHLPMPMENKPWYWPF